jgi:WD40 repeat protein
MTYFLVYIKYNSVRTEGSKEIGHLKGHSDWVASIETTHPRRRTRTQVLITASRDRTILIWKFNNESKGFADFGEPV